MIQRTQYSVLDLASDVGGMGRVLVAGSTVVLAILNYDYLDNYLASRLFQIKIHQQPPRKGEFKAKSDDTSHTVSLKPSKWCGVKHLCYTLCCRQFCSRGLKNKRARSMELVRKTLAQETDIVALVRKQRLFMKALNRLMSKAEV